jgi:25S rRNA (adenine2142-N1)-methyltransferase
MRKKKRALVPPPVKSLKVARQVTSAFHKGQSSDRAAYQAASQAATARHKTTARYVFSRLQSLGRRPAAGRGAARPRLLEIGAVNTQLLACPWLATRAIDVRPAARGIEGLDFFDLNLPKSKDGGESSFFDVVVCAMVLNCVPSAADRGAMLARIAAVLRRPDGLAMIALPVRCVRGGRAACTRAAFEGAMAAAGLGPVLDRAQSAKVAFWTVGVLPEEEGTGGVARPSLPYSTGGEAGGPGEFSVVVTGGVDAGARVK